MPINGVPIACPNCGAALPDERVDQPRLGRCEICGRAVRVVTFPLLRVGYVPGRAGESLQADGEASCFYHPHKRAAVPCDACGRFLCSLCDVELGRRHLCPACVEAELCGPRAPDAAPSSGVPGRRFLYDSLALTLAVWPLLIWPTTLVTAPMAVFVALRHWRSAGGVIARTKARMTAALALAGVQLAGWAVLLYRWIY